MKIIDLSEASEQQVLKESLEIMDKANQVYSHFPNKKSSESLVVSPEAQFFIEEFQDTYNEILQSILTIFNAYCPVIERIRFDGVLNNSLLEQQKNILQSEEENNTTVSELKENSENRKQILNNETLIVVGLVNESLEKIRAAFARLKNLSLNKYFQEIVSQHQSPYAIKATTVAHPIGIGHTPATTRKRQ